MIQTIIVRDRAHWLEMRTKDITSTEISVLFGYKQQPTLQALWMAKKHGYDMPFKETEQMFWGKQLQPSIAEGLAKQCGWIVRRKDEYIRDSELRIGSSFDYEVCHPVQAILEIKNVDGWVFKSIWGAVGETVLAPKYVELQVQHQMMVSGLQRAYIGGLIGGNKAIILPRKADPRIQALIREHVASFWKTIQEDKPPLPLWRKEGITS